MLQKYLRVFKRPAEKQFHLTRLAEALDTPQWHSVLHEVEDMLVKGYQKFDECSTMNEFVKVQAEVKALKQISGLSKLASIVAKRQTGFVPPE